MVREMDEAEAAAVGPNNNRVFVLQRNPHLDYDDARRFGLLVPVIQRDVFVDDLPSRLDQMKATIEAVLGKFDSSCDYLLLTGDPIAIFMSGALLRDAGPVKVLKFDRQAGRYYAVEVNFS